MASHPILELLWSGEENIFLNFTVPAALPCLTLPSVFLAEFTQAYCF